jgi:hypothetical protein
VLFAVDPVATHEEATAGPEAGTPAAQTNHAYSVVGAGVPRQVPAVTLTVAPTRLVPDTTGVVVRDGASVTAEVEADQDVYTPEEFVADVFRVRNVPASCVVGT